MSNWIVVLIGAVVCWAQPLCAQTGASARSEGMSGGTNTIVLRGGDCEVVLLPGLGARIGSYTLNGDGILWFDTNKTDRANMPERPGLAGGALTEAFNAQGPLPEMPQWSTRPWLWESLGPNSVRFLAPTGPETGLALEKQVVVDPEGGDIGLQHRLRSASNQRQVVGLRSRSVLRGGGFVVMPVGEKTRYKAGWALGRLEGNGGVRWDGDNPSDPRVQVSKGLLAVRAGGTPLRVTAEGGAGWVMYTAGQLVHTRFFGGEGAASGARVTVEIGLSGDSVELLLSLGPAEIGPGLKLGLLEAWTLSDLERSVVSFDEARGLAKRLPASPLRPRKP